MNDTTITSANSIFTITVPGLFNSPQQLQGYAADKAWTTEGMQLAETQMGVDGRKTSGYTPVIIKQTVSLQADSPSKVIFNTIAAATIAARDTYNIEATISLPSTGESFTCHRGTLTNFKPVPDAAKVLQPMDFVLEWESVTPTLL